jgi:chromosome segregation ATPase
VLEDEIQKLKNAAAMGDQNAGDLQRLLAETQMKLEKALNDITGLEGTIEDNTKQYNSEYNRLNNILKATNGNMQEQITKLSDQIKKLQKEIADLKTNLNRVENEK